MSPPASSRKLRSFGSTLHAGGRSPLGCRVWTPPRRDIPPRHRPATDARSWQNQCAAQTQSARTPVCLVVTLFTWLGVSTGPLSSLSEPSDVTSWDMCSYGKAYDVSSLRHLPIARCINWRKNTLQSMSTYSHAHMFVYVDGWLAGWMDGMDGWIQGLRACVRVLMHAGTWVHVYVCSHVRGYVCTYACMYAWMGVFSYACIWTCVCMHM